MEPRTEKGLGFKPGPVDTRDRRLASYVEATARQTTGSRFWSNPCRLDQGAQGACVGFGHVQGYNAVPKRHRADNDFATDVYRRATLIDEWPDEDWRNSEGTSMRAGAKVMKERGLYKAYAFADGVEEMLLWLLNNGPVVIGVDWYEGMDDAEARHDYFIEPTGRVRGGHCTLLDGVRYFDGPTDYVRGLNSWSKSWGMDGRFRMAIPDLKRLFESPNSVAVTSVDAS